MAAALALLEDTEHSAACMGKYDSKTVHHVSHVRPSVALFPCSGCHTGCEHARPQFHRGTIHLSCCAECQHCEQVNNVIGVLHLS